MSYSYFGKINFDESVLNDCISLIDMPETIPLKHPDPIYKDFLPDQTRFLIRQTQKFYIKGIDLENSNYYVILQLPGRMLPWHIDVFDEKINSGKFKGIRTYLCFLKDWAPGQIFGTEHDTYTHWSAGDTIWWDYKVWHYSSNASILPKYTMQIQEGYY